MVKIEENTKIEINNYISSLAFDNISKINACNCEICNKRALDLSYISTELRNHLVAHHIFCDENVYNELYIKFIVELEKFGIIYNNKLYCKECYDQVKNLTNISKSISRPSKIEYYLNIAKEVSTRSTCLRRKYGAIIVKNDSIISTGYNGAPRCTKNCIDLGECRREKLNIPRGQNYEMCRAVHAEQNCIINASKDQMLDSELYLYGSDYNGQIVENMTSCQICKKMIINAGIKNVICAKPNNQYKVYNVNYWIINDETLTDKFGY